MSELPPISSTITDTSPCSGSVHAPVMARPSIASTVLADASFGDTRRQHLIVLQAIELPWLERPRLSRRVHHDLDNGRASVG